MTPRKCPNWLDTFTQWTVPRSEAKETFILWTGLFTLSSAIRRRVWVPKKYLGSWQVHPNLYIIFVAPAGRGRKTTTAGYAEELLEDIPNVRLASAAMTQQVLMKRIADNPDASISIRSSEFGTFIAPSGNLMFDFLTDLYDGKKRHDSDTLSRGLEFAANPCVNLLAATTPQWISDNMSESAIGGGFASRVIFIYEESVRRRQIFYESLDYKALENMKDNLKADLAYLASNIEGEFSLAPDAKEFIEEWYRDTADSYPLEDHRTHGYYERKPAHALKVSMLLHLAYADDCIITLADFNESLRILSQIERKLPRAFQAIGKNPYSVEMDHITEYVDVKGRIKKRDVMKHFYQAAPPNILSELISALVVMGEIIVDGGNPAQGDEPMLVSKSYKEPIEPKAYKPPAGSLPTTESLDSESESPTHDQSAEED